MTPEELSLQKNLCFKQINGKFDYTPEEIILSYV
jgi:hypothetical protein